jgi:fructose-1,6-bisphosphatase/inositol monophosphatase family enzyme
LRLGETIGRRILTVGQAGHKVVSSSLLAPQAELLAQNTPLVEGVLMSERENDPIGLRLEWAVQIAREAGNSTLRYFRQADLRIEQKADDSPVTAADREAEQLLRRRIAERFPHDAILGEELGGSDGTSGFQWVLDPIDGTKSFIHGVPLYTTLVAVLEQGQESGKKDQTRVADLDRLLSTHNSRPCIGVIDAPATGETVYAASGQCCWYLAARSAEPKAARVSTTSRLRDGTLLTSDTAGFATARRRDATEAWLALQREARMTRTWGDGYGYLLVATGRAEVMIDPIMNLWDAATLQPILEEAGGQFTDWQGVPTVHSGEGLATNGLVADEVLAVVQGW